MLLKNVLGQFGAWSILMLHNRNVVPLQTVNL